jgi:hypothetical protein
MALAQKNGHWVSSVEEHREREIFEMLEERHPESLELLGELSNLVGALMNQAEDRGIKRHGAQILQMIEGSRYQPMECASPSVETPGDDDLNIFVERAES